MTIPLRCGLHFIRKCIKYHFQVHTVIGYKPNVHNKEVNIYGK